MTKKMCNDVKKLAMALPGMKTVSLNEGEE